MINSGEKSSIIPNISWYAEEKDDRIGKYWILNDKYMSFIKAICKDETLKLQILVPSKVTSKNDILEMWSIIKCWFTNDELYKKDTTE